MTDPLPVLDIDRRHAADERRRELRLLGTAGWPNGDTGRANEDIEADRIMAGADDTAERVQKFARFRVELTTRPDGDEVVLTRRERLRLEARRVKGFVAWWLVVHLPLRPQFLWWWLLPHAGLYAHFDEDRANWSRTALEGSCRG